MSDYVQRVVLPVLRDKTGVPLMKELLHRWNNHKIYVKWMDRFFTYLDRYYVKLQSVEPLHNRGYSILHQLVFEEVKKDTRGALLSVINLERQGEHIDQDLVKGIIDMFIDLGLGNASVYNNEFEEHFLPATSDYFVRQASGWILEDSFPEYLRKAEAALIAEEQRVTNYLHRSTQPKLKHVVIQALLAQPQPQLMEKETGVVYLLENEKREDLARMHRMFTLVDNGPQPIAQAFRQYVTDRGNRIVDERVEQSKVASKTEALGDPSFIQTLLDLHDRFKGIVQECFSQDSLFQKSLKEAFEVFVNRDIGKYSFAALMSSFCDRILKKSGERLSDDQVEMLLSKMVELFSFLSDKDLFAEIYRNQLSKRLLYETSASEDAEKSMIAKLKMKCGAQFTSKLEGMITDLSLASDLVKDFREHCENLTEDKGSLGGIDFNVTVLTTGFWPSYTVQDANLCPEMQKAISVFHNFYNGRTQHRRLQWIHSLGQATIAARLGGRRHDLIVNSYQALILLLFVASERYDLSFIQSSTGLDAALSKKLMHTLAMQKYRILTKSGADAKTVEDDAAFEPNDTFQCPHRKIKIPPPTSEETHNKERVEEDRSIAIEAAIVRIMKMRKQLSHQHLVTEVLTQLAFFKPSPKLIKQRIEHLIEREYLERDPNQASMYRYLA